MRFDNFIKDPLSRPERAIVIVGTSSLGEVSEAFNKYFEDIERYFPEFFKKEINTENENTYDISKYANTIYREIEKYINSLTIENYYTNDIIRIQRLPSPGYPSLKTRLEFILRVLHVLGKTGKDCCPSTLRKLLVELASQDSTRDFACPVIVYSKTFTPSIPALWFLDRGDEL
jgi:hypothetical protein